jgi:hypothetical protein
MRIQPNVLRCVAFLCEPRGDPRREVRTPVGTCFFVDMACEADRGLRWVYLVTAKHCIEQCERDVLYVRVNTRDQGKYVDLPTNRDDWFLHDEADVAVIPSPVPLSSGQRTGTCSEIASGELDFTACPSEEMIGPGPFYQWQGTGDNVGVGDELFSVGLFLQHSGKERNLPVARFGHVSRMPDKLDLNYTIGQYDTGREIVAYLAEFLSWGGFSGSPVFWLSPTLERLRVMQSGHTEGVFGCLLGLASAHFVIPEKAKVSGDVLGQISTRLNSGLAIITPAEAIRQILLRDDLAQDREQRYQKHKEQAADCVQLDSTPDIP